MSDTELRPLVITTAMLNRWGKTSMLAEQIVVALDQGRRVIVEGADLQETMDKLRREEDHNLLFPADATGLERKCNITPTPFTKTTPRQRANKGAKWYTPVRKGRREW